jgi:hypothetical protein
MGPQDKFVVAVAIAGLAVFLLTTVRSHEPNKIFGRLLPLLIYLTAALAIIAKFR